MKRLPALLLALAFCAVPAPALASTTQPVIRSSISAATPAGILNLPTSVDVTASPSPVLRGRIFAVAGTVRTVLGTHPRIVKYYFSRGGTAPYAYRATSTTDSAGRFSAAFTAQYSGRWQVVASPYSILLAGSASVLSRVYVMSNVIASYHGGCTVSGTQQCHSAGRNFLAWVSPSLYIPTRTYAVDWSFWYSAAPAYGCPSNSWLLVRSNPDGSPLEPMMDGCGQSGHGTFHGFYGARSGSFRVVSIGYVSSRWTATVRAGALHAVYV